MAEGRDNSSGSWSDTIGQMANDFGKDIREAAEDITEDAAQAAHDVATGKGSESKDD